MRFLLIVISIFASSVINAQNIGRDWVYQRNTSLTDLFTVGTSVGSTAGLSWPDGRQAIITYVNTPGPQGSVVYRCVEYFDEEMNLTNSRCYKLKKN